MFSEYDRPLSRARITRTGTVTVDNRSESDLVKQLQAEVQALRQALKDTMRNMEGQ